MTARGFAAALALGLIALAPAARPQSFTLPAAAVSDPAALDKAMPVLAETLIAAWRDDDRQRYLDGLFRLQIVAGRNQDAAQSLNELRALRSADPSPGVRAKDLHYAILLRARAIEQSEHAPFDVAFGRAFRESLATLDDTTSALLVRAMSQYSPGISLHAPLDERLRAELAKRKGGAVMSLADALALVRAYQAARADEAVAPLAPALIAEDDRRRYVIEERVVPTTDRAGVCATIVRQRSSTGPQPTLLEFTIYADPSVTLSEARRTASNGYVGVEGLTRGKGCGPGRAVPYEHDGADAAALIEWISHQPWSDGRVGMFGASYTGFTVWAAAKHRLPALKAIMDAVTNIPGVNSPMEGGVTTSFGYYWPFYTTNNKTVDDAAFDARNQWNDLFRKWYLSGKAYRTMDTLEGPPNPIWDHWLDHPDYDAYWQAMVPYRQQFAAIDIPVLTTTGYYDGGQIGALYALTQQEKYNPRAPHYLVIGPYDHHSGNRGTVDVLGEEANVLDGYEIDPAAHMDFGELRYRWFDYVFKGGPKPPILGDRINYEVMGASVWKHAPSVGAMSGHALRLYLSGAPAANAFSLAARAPKGDQPVSQSMDFKDRSDVDHVSEASGDIINSHLDTYGSVVFESAPFDRPVEMSGLFSGHLDFITNKKDFDFEIQLYELTPRGKYFALSYYITRASYVADLSHRHLLTPGVPQRLDFTSGRLTSRRIERGSRLVMVLSLIKMPAAQINYGSGKPVSDETIADAGPPLQIAWRPASFIDVPLGD